MASVFLRLGVMLGINGTFPIYVTLKRIFRLFSGTIYLYVNSPFDCANCGEGHIR